MRDLRVPPQGVLQGFRRDFLRGVLQGHRRLISSQHDVPLDVESAFSAPGVSGYWLFVLRTKKLGLFNDL